MFTADNNNPDVVGDVPIDSIAEVKADTNSYSAAYGNGSSVFNVMTKTGTNRFHGSLFEYVRNTVFNARNYFEDQTSPFHWNEFGGTIGGPIKRNKAFFFFSYQDERQVTYSPTYHGPDCERGSGQFFRPGVSNRVRSGKPRQRCPNCLARQYNSLVRDLSLGEQSRAILAAPNRSGLIQQLFRERHLIRTPTAGIAETCSTTFPRPTSFHSP